MLINPSQTQRQHTSHEKSLDKAEAAACLYICLSLSPHKHRYEDGKDQTPLHLAGYSSFTTHPCGTHLEELRLLAHSLSCHLRLAAARHSRGAEAEAPIALPVPGSPTVAGVRLNSPRRLCRHHSSPMQLAEAPRRCLLWLRRGERMMRRDKDERERPRRQDKYRRERETNRGAGNRGIVGERLVSVIISNQD